MTRTPGEADAAGVGRPRFRVIAPKWAAGAGPYRFRHTRPPVADIPPNVRWCGNVEAGSGPFRRGDRPAPTGI